MGPFTEATYDELSRILAVVDNPKSRNGGHLFLNLDWVLAWVDGEEKYPTYTTLQTIEEWEDLLRR